MFVHHPYPDLRAQPASVWTDANFHPDHQAFGKLVWDASMAMAITKVWPWLGEGVSPTIYFFAVRTCTRYPTFSLCFGGGFYPALKGYSPRKRST